MEDDVLTTTDAARMLGISVRTAQLLIEGGRVPSWKTPGGHRRVHRSSVQALLEQAHPPTKQMSATVMVVAQPERRASFEGVLAGVGHLLPEFHASLGLAAIALGARTPAVVVVDSDSWTQEAAVLVGALATDVRFRLAEFVLVTPNEKRRPKPLPARVRLTTLSGLVELLRVLTEERVHQDDRIVDGDFLMPSNEASRLEAVKRAGIVDTPAEDSFDRVTWLASRGLKSPIALMTVLTADRQWFKSRQGLDMLEAPRSWAFCNHTILQREVFEVQDLSKHPSFKNNPTVVDGPRFRFYAGAPVYDPDGFALGSICIMDHHPRRLDKNQRRMLSDLAAVASDEVKLRDLVAKR